MTGWLKAEYKGTKWTDIDWTQEIHFMEYCSACGISGDDKKAHGHLLGCPYGTGSEWVSSQGFFNLEIKAALERESNEEKK
jgi:hypothetical protein